MFRNFLVTVHLLFAVLFMNQYVLAQEETGYIELKPAQPTLTGDKIEVVEVFWYGCPHCYNFEPFLEQWLKTIPADVQLIRVPGVLREDWMPLGKAYYTAEKLGILDKIHRPLFDAIHVGRTVSQFPDEDQLVDFFVSKGVNEAQFTQTFGSKEVDAKIRQAYFLAKAYKLPGVPALVINGKYLIPATRGKSYEDMITIMNGLIEKERQAKQ